MFDVGFSEMIVIAVVALIVIGPEKLPKVARTVGALIGRMQRYVNDVKADINREIELDELKKMHTSVKEAADSIHSSVRETISGFESQASEINAAVIGETRAPEPAPQMSDAELSAAIREAETQAGYGTPGAPESIDTAQASLPLELPAELAVGPAAETAPAVSPAPAVPAVSPAPAMPARATPTAQEPAGPVA
jgi:sec-independent protein translocase protein TatB